MLSNATKLTEIYLSYNEFTGKVPTLASMSNLRVLSMQAIGLGNGEDDDLSFLYTLSNSSKLETLAINENNFGGVLPDIISNFSTKLKHMTFGSNQIRGHIPDGIGNLVSLRALGLEANQLTGSIPNSIEYGIGSDVSTLEDVYSYGILLLEMITGKRPTNSMFKDGIELHNYVKMALPDHVADVADPKLLIEVDQGNDSHQKILECLKSISNVGLFCSEKFPRERMEMNNVVVELNRIKASFLLR
ncbi:LRR receptor serine/threonine-protein kinase [Salix suchowensis]|nr:LRR receptor serine/threonine-protein kinase [Salix suchowensis]